MHAHKATVTSGASVTRDKIFTVSLAARTTRVEVPRLG